MSARLKTELEWENLGYLVAPGSHSEHKNKWGEFLYRPDQVEEPYAEELDEYEGWPIEDMLT